MFNFKDKNTWALVFLIAALLMWMNGRAENFTSPAYYNGYDLGGDRYGGFPSLGSPYYGHGPGCAYGGYNLPEKYYY